MKCPFCGEEMVHGYLYSGQGSGFPWYPDGEKPARYVPDIRVKKKGAKVFGNPDFEPGQFDSMSFWLCNACKKGVADSLSEKKIIRMF